jgi:hypothetical protein
MKILCITPQTLCKAQKKFILRSFYAYFMQIYAIYIRPLCTWYFADAAGATTDRDSMTLTVTIRAC